MTDAQHTLGKSRWRVWLIRALISFSVLCIGWQWWEYRPEKVARHFMDLLYKGQIPEARKLLVDPSAMEANEGDIVLKADDGTSATLTTDDLPLVRFDRPNWRYRNGIDDRLACRFHFLLMTFSPAVENHQRRAVEVHCTAEGAKVIIKSIK